MYDIYGIVNVEKRSNNKGLIAVYVSHIFVIPPKCTKKREPKDECCVSQCT